MAKLLIKMINIPFHPRCRAALCFEDGSPLPCQVNTTLVSNVDGSGRMTVDFVIDGENLKVVKDGPPPAPKDW